MKVSLAVSASLLSAVSSALMLVVLSRYASPGEVAHVLTLQVTIAFALILIEFGIGKELTLVAARGPLSEFNYLNRLHFWAAMLIGIVAVMSAFFFGLGPVAVLVTLYCVSERRVAVGLSCSIATGRVRTSSSILIVTRVVSLIALVAVVLYLGADASIAYVSVLAFSSLSLAAALNWVVVRPQADSRDRRTLGQILSTSIHYWVTSILAQIRTLDIAIVSYFVTPNMAAAYALPARALQPLRLLGTSMASVAFPLASSGDLSRTRGLVRSSCFFGIAGVLLVASALPAVPLLIEMAVGSDYREAAIPLVLFALGAAINLPGAVLSAVVQASGKQRQITFLGGALLAFQMIALLLLVHPFGINGAAAAVASTYALQLLVVSILYRKLAHEK